MSISRNKESSLDEENIYIYDGVAIHYIEDEVNKIVSSRPNAKAYKVYFDKEIREILT